MGVLGDALLRATPWGLNATLWVGAFAAAALALARLKGAPAGARDARWLWLAVVLFAAGFAWRDSLTLRALDALMILGALALIALQTRSGRLHLAGVSEYALAALTAGANALFGVFPLIFADVRWGELPRSGWSRHAWAVARGALIAVPLLAVFGALFVAADAVYEGLVNNVISFEADVTFSHIFIAVFVAWLTGGYLRGALLARRPLTTFSGFGRHTALNLSVTKPPTPAAAADDKPGAAAEASRRESADLRGLFSEGGAVGSGAQATGGGTEADRKAATGGAEAGRGEAGKNEAAGDRTQTSQPPAGSPAGSPAEAARPQRRVSLGMVEVGVVLGLLDALFLSFVAVQLRYFFGDAAHVVSSAGLTFSDYARRGFFELVWVAVLALPVLLAAHWLLRKDEAGRGERLFRALAGAMLAMLFVIMASALWRMRLYQTAYGQTELRFYTTAFMCWLGAVFVWFALTVLRGRRERFALGAVVAGFIVVAALHALNPTDAIVRSNLARARATGRFDAHYAVSLGDDAVPTLVAALPEMNAGDRSYVARRLLGNVLLHEQHDWRSWNLARARARRAVADNETAIGAWAREWQAGTSLRGAGASEPPPPPPPATY